MLGNLSFVSAFLTLAVATPAMGQRQLERLDRGLVAVHAAPGHVFVSWRLLASDVAATRFNVYRRDDDQPAVRLNAEPLADATCFLDEKFDQRRAGAYSVRAIVDGVEHPASSEFALPADPPVRPYLSIPLQTPEGYHANDCSVGDLDGDGRYELVVHMVGQGRDNSRGGFSTEPIFHAYTLDGQLLWKINLGKNIREGAHYTQFLVYDFDGDGRAELACKTADGTTDGVGKVIGDPHADHRWGADEGTRAGLIQRGPEFLTVFDGQTGAALATVDYVPPRGGEGSAWGDRNANRVDRFLAGVAYLDGQRPSLVMCRGYYTRCVLAAWDWRDGQLTSRWIFDSDDGKEGHRAYRGQGNHSLSVADVDDDGRDEVIYGSCVIDDNGRGLFSTGLGHGDALHVGDLAPRRPGLEVWGIHENPQRTPDRPGAALYDARTGKILFQDCLGEDVGRGMAADIDPRHSGAELWGGSNGLRTVVGTRIGRAPRSNNFAIWWDGDLLRELLNGVDISKWDYVAQRETPLFSGREARLASNNSSKANPCLSADVIGDWREELIARTADNRELRIYTTTIPTSHRFTTLMHDAQYRLAVAWQNVGYNQPPHPSFFLGVGMRPTLYIVGDSTVRNGTRGQRGWGDELAAHFDPARIDVQNHAIGGRSSRTFQTEGRWDRILAKAKPGDFVLIQMGHNDGGSLDDSQRARGTLPGIGDETREIDNPLTKKRETVHTYGWYLRKYVTDAKAKGMTPILVSPIPHAPRQRVQAGEREKSRHVVWCEELATRDRALFVDLNRLVMAHYADREPTEIRTKYFSESDGTHTNVVGAKLNAETLAAGLRALPACELGKYLVALPSKHDSDQDNREPGAIPAAPPNKKR